MPHPPRVLLSRLSDQGPSSAASDLVSFGTSEEDVIADDSMSLATSDAEEWGGSGGGQPAGPRPDAELIRALSKAVEYLGREWPAPEEPAHGLSDEWYLPGSRQQSSRQRPPHSCLQFMKNSPRRGAPPTRTE